MVLVQDVSKTIVMCFHCCSWVTSLDWDATASIVLNHIHCFHEYWSDDDIILMIGFEVLWRSADSFYRPEQEGLAVLSYDMTLHLQFSQKSLSLVSIICAEDWSIHFSARKLSVFCYHLMWLTSVKKHFLPLLLKKPSIEQDWTLKMIYALTSICHGCCRVWTDFVHISTAFAPMSKRQSLSAIHYLI